MPEMAEVVIPLLPPHPTGRLSFTGLKRRTFSPFPSRSLPAHHIEISSVWLHVQNVTGRQALPSGHSTYLVKLRRPSVALGRDDQPDAASLDVIPNG